MQAGEKLVEFGFPRKFRILRTWAYWFLPDASLISGALIKVPKTPDKRKGSLK